MARRKSKRIQEQQRQHTQNAEPSSKRAKIGVTVEADGAPSQMKITDLNADCLEHIFKYLDFNDLLKVADSRKSFKEGVDQTFASKYKKRDVNHSIFDDPHRFNDNMIWNDPQLESDRIVIKRDFVSCLKFLRCFGKSTSTLKIDYARLRKHKGEGHALEHYVSKYCAKTLTELTLVNPPEDAMSGLKQPFIKLKKLHVEGDLRNKLANFNRWFPILQHLQIDWISTFTDIKCIEVHMPQLTHLEIKDPLGVFRVRSVSKCLRLNPQLQMLGIGNQGNLRSILKAASKLRQLEQLHIRPYKNDFVHMNDVIHFKRVKKFRLDYYEKFCSQPLSKIPLSFEQLEEFSMNAENPAPSINAIKQFVGAHPSIQKWNVTPSGEYYNQDTDSGDDDKEILEKLTFGNGWRASFKLGHKYTSSGVKNYYDWIGFERKN